jgi:hypothetical protein
MPFLSENMDDEDEVLLAESEQLGNFASYVGGPQYAHVLLPLLEQLSTVEETVVRDKAVESMAKIGSVLPDSATCDFFVPIVKVRGWSTVHLVFVCVHLHRKCKGKATQSFPFPAAAGYRGVVHVTCLVLRALRNSVPSCYATAQV